MENQILLKIFKDPNDKENHENIHINSSIVYLKMNSFFVNLAESSLNCFVHSIILC